MNLARILLASGLAAAVATTVAACGGASGAVPTPGASIGTVADQAIPKKILALPVALAAATIGLAGCGGSGSTASSGTASSAAPSSTVPPATPSPAHSSVGHPSTMAGAGGSGSGSMKPAAASGMITTKNSAYQVSGPVRPGEKVTVKNNGHVAHTVTSDQGNSLFNVTVQPGHTMTFTAPAKPGTYKFHCNFHANMHGTLVVK